MDMAPAQLPGLVEHLTEKGPCWRYLCRSTCCPTFQGKTLLPSLELATRGEGIFSTSLSRNSISWADASTPVPRDIEPRAVFDRMFRAGKSGFANSSVRIWYWRMLGVSSGVSVIMINTSLMSTLNLFAPERRIELPRSRNCVLCALRS